MEEAHRHVPRQLDTCEVKEAYFRFGFRSDRSGGRRDAERRLLPVDTPAVDDTKGRRKSAGKSVNRVEASDGRRVAPSSIASQPSDAKVSELVSDLVSDFEEGDAQVSSSPLSLPTPAQDLLEATFKLTNTSAGPTNANESKHIGATQRC
jgi:hypothetical protein